MKLNKYFDIWWILEFVVSNGTYAPFLKNSTSSLKSKLLAKATYWNYLLKGSKEITLHENSVVFIRPTNAEFRNMDKIYNAIENKDIIRIDALNIFSRNKGFIITPEHKRKAKEIHQAYKELKLQPKHIYDFYFSVDILALIVCYYDTYDALIKKYHPKLFVVDENSDMRTRAMCLAAKDNNVKVLHIYHGLDIEENKFSYINNVIKSVPGQYQKDQLLKLGYKDKDVHITGPIFFNIDTKSVKQLDYTLFLTTSVVEDGYITAKEYKQEMQDMLAELKEMGINNIIVRMHPREKGKKMYEKLGCSVDTTTKLSTLIKECKLVVAYGSGAMVEAIMYNKPVLYMHNLYEGYNLSKGNYIMDSLYNSKLSEQKTFVDTIIFNDGKAIENNIALIERFI